MEMLRGMWQDLVEILTRISWRDYAFPLTLLALALVAVLIRLLALSIQAHLRQVRTGVEGLIGVRGRVEVGGESEGRATVQGEDWQARWRGSLSRGDKVRVVKVDGLVLEVEPIES